jgi:hypothetical protein
VIGGWRGEETKKKKEKKKKERKDRHERVTNDIIKSSPLMQNKKNAVML